MDTFMHQVPATPEAVVDRVVKDASRIYRGVDQQTLTSIAEQAVQSLWGDSVKVTTFIPVLAMREVAQVLTHHEERLAVE